MIEARRISKFFSIVDENGIAAGLTAVLSVSLRIPSGRFVSLVGPTGCGKSTFLEILAGLQAPTEGEVYIDGKLVLEPLPGTRKEMEEYRKRYRFLSPITNSLIRNNPKHDIAMIFQDYAVFPWMTALKNVMFTLELRGVRRSDRKGLALRYLADVGLAGAESKYPSQMSGGMRQRLALARALSVEPKIILMDEPFAAVDAMTRERLQDDLLRLWEETGKTIVMVTHDIDEALYLSDDIVVFSPLPGTIRNQIAVDIPRPRSRDAVDMSDLKTRIRKIYEYDAYAETEYSI